MKTSSTRALLVLLIFGGGEDLRRSWNHPLRRRGDTRAWRLIAHIWLSYGCLPGGASSEGIEGARGAGRLQSHGAVFDVYGAGEGDKAQAARISDPGEARGKIHCGVRGSRQRQHSLELLRNSDRLHRLHSRPQSLYKQGKFLPGTHIPIYAPQKIEETKPDYVLILPWNFKDEIMAQMAHIRKWGGRFVTPIPQVKVYP